MLHCLAVSCSVLYYFAVVYCSSVLQCLEVFCSVLQCVSVRFWMWEYTGVCCWGQDFCSPDSDSGHTFLVTRLNSSSWLMSGEFKCVTWRIHMCYMTCVTWLIYICVTWLIYMCVTWLIHMCVTWLIHMCVTWLIHMCVIWLIHMCNMTHSHVLHDSFICTT